MLSWFISQDNHSKCANFEYFLNKNIIVLMKENSLPDKEYIYKGSLGGGHMLPYAGYKQ